MNNNVQIDAQELINKMTQNFANELAVREQRIANLQVTIETLQRQLNDAKQAKEATKKGGK